MTGNGWEWLEWWKMAGKRTGNGWNENGCKLLEKIVNG